MDILAKYAKIAQNNNMVPIVEPEVLINGVHDIHRAHEVSSACLSVLFEELEKKEEIAEHIPKIKEALNLMNLIHSQNEL